MKLKHLLLSFIAITTIAACSSNSRKFNIIGNISGMPQQTIVLIQWNANDVVTIVDSTRSNADGHFELSGIAPEMGLYRLDFRPKKFILLAVDKGNIKIDGDWNKLEDYKVSGSASSEDLKNLLGDIRTFTRDNISLSIVMDTLKAKGKDSMLNAVNNDIADRRQHFAQDLEHYADTVSYEPNAIFAVRMLSATSEKYYLQAFAQSLNRRFPGTKMTKDYSDWYAAASEKQRAPAKPLELGMPAPDLSLQDMDGKQVSLSSFRGKYVLLDFWASWCQPCRNENPHVVAAYKKYHDKNFTVLGVSLDSKKSDWEKAIMEDSLSWTQVSDLKSWNSSAVITYDIHAIPSNYLIDPSGKIIAHNLHGSDIEALLERELKPKPTTPNP
jgi:peroxiredoxin